MTRSLVILLVAARMAAGGFFIVEENDYPFRSDRYYTQGLEAGLRFPVKIRDGEPERWGIAVRNLMYTPQDISIAEPQPDDRPWAGSTVLVVDRRRKSGDWYDCAGVSVGVAGRLSGSAELQTWFHDLIGTQEPMGWDNQIPDEPVVNFRLERRRILWETELYGVRVAEVSFSGGGDLGTAFIDAFTGIDIKAGYNVPRGWGLDVIGPSVVLDDLSVYVFVETLVKAVGHNVMLGGSMLQSGPSRDLKRVVPEIRAGLGVEAGWMDLGFGFFAAAVFRGEEFRGQDGGQAFGSVGISVTRRL